MSEKKISVSWKPGTGFESPLINVQGDSAAEVEHNLRELVQGGLLSRVLQVAVNSQQEYAGLKRANAGYAQPAEEQAPPPQDQSYAASPQQQYTPPPQQAYQAPANQQEPPGWAGQPPTGQQGGYGGQPAPQQSYGAPAAQQAPQGGRQGPVPVCQCGQQMEYKETGTTKKPVYRCPSWRWNNGNPTPQHDQVWI